MRFVEATELRVQLRAQAARRERADVELTKGRESACEHVLDEFEPLGMPRGFKIGLGEEMLLGERLRIVFT